MNESFYRALAVADASLSPLRGNQIVTGRSGIVTLLGFNPPVWGLPLLNAQAPALTKIPP